MDKSELFLKTQIKDYESLFDLLKEQKKIFMDSKQISIVELNKKIEMLFLKINKQEKLLSDLTDDDKYDDLKDQLNKNRQKVKELVEENSILLKNKMQFIDFNINIMTCSTTGNSYGNLGQDKIDTKLKIFDTSV